MIIGNVIRRNGNALGKPSKLLHFLFCEPYLQSLEPGDDGEPGHGHDGQWEDGPGQPPAPRVEDAERNIGLPHIGGD